MRRPPVCAAISLAFAAAVCSKHAPESAAGPQTFASADAAAQAVYDAAKGNDTDAVLRIFGPTAKEFLLTGEPTQDGQAFKEFTDGYDHMHRWGKLLGGDRVLSSASRTIPSPSPFAEALTDSGNSTRREVGRSFLRAASGTTNRSGASAEPESPIGPLVAQAGKNGSAESGGSAAPPAPFHGYFPAFRTSRARTLQVALATISLTVTGSTDRSGRGVDTRIRSRFQLGTRQVSNPALNLEQSPSAIVARRQTTFEYPLE